MTDYHPCPITGCPRTVASHLLMCCAHYRALKQAPGGQVIVSELYGAWRARKVGVEGSLRRHQIAMERAIAAVEGREPDLSDLRGDQ